MKPIDAIRSLSAIISSNNNDENITRLYLINLISRGITGISDWDTVKSIIKEKTGIILEVDQKINKLIKEEYCGFKGGICTVKRRKLLSRSLQRTEYGIS